jgi:hypothetical protein
MTSKGAALVILAAMLASPAMADRDSVGTLRNLCRSQNGVEKLMCLEYVTGVFDMTVLAGFAYKGEIDTPADRAIIGLLGAACYNIAANETLPMGAVVQAFLNWADRHPQEWGKSRAFGVSAALSEAWPCK